MSRRKDIIIIGNNKFQTLVAVTSKEHEIGLMFKPWPPPIMSFPYDTASVKKFWMKNTPSPLDIIFCRCGFIIDIQEGKPYDRTLIGPNSPVDLVIEVPYGMAQNYGMRIGDSVQIKYSMDTLVKKIKFS